MPNGCQAADLPSRPDILLGRPGNFGRPRPGNLGSPQDSLGSLDSPGSSPGGRNGTPPAHRLVRHLHLGLLWLWEITICSR